MPRKDASAQYTPVDQYRKQIGKQDWKKSRKDVRAMKNRADEDPVLTTQNIVLMIGAVIAVFSLVYMMLFWYLGMARLEDIREAPPV